MATMRKWELFLFSSLWTPFGHTNFRWMAFWTGLSTGQTGASRSCIVHYDLRSIHESLKINTDTFPIREQSTFWSDRLHGFLDYLKKSPLHDIVSASMMLDKRNFESRCAWEEKGSSTHRWRPGLFQFIPSHRKECFFFCWAGNRISWFAAWLCMTPLRCAFKY